MRATRSCVERPSSRHSALFSPGFLKTRGLYRLSQRSGQPGRSIAGYRLSVKPRATRGCILLRLGLKNRIFADSDICVVVIGRKLETCILMLAGAVLSFSEMGLTLPANISAFLLGDGPGIARDSSVAYRVEHSGQGSYGSGFHEFESARGFLVACAQRGSSLARNACWLITSNWHCESKVMCVRLSLAVLRAAAASVGMRPSVVVMADCLAQPFFPLVGPTRRMRLARRHHSGL